MSLRWYQRDAVQAGLASLSRGESPIIVLPTGSGKTWVMSELCLHLPRRILVLSHRKELLCQNATRIRAHTGYPVTLYSSGLGQKDLSGTVVVGGVQSIVNVDADALSGFTSVIVDEAHMIPANESSQYRQVLSMIGDYRLIGLTATPYRLREGLVYGAGCLFSECAYDLNVLDLVKEGFLTPLVNKSYIDKSEFKNIKKTSGDYSLGEQDNFFFSGLDNYLAQMLEHCFGRKRILVFTTTIQMAEYIGSWLSTKGESVAIVHSKLPTAYCDKVLASYSKGAVRFLVNVNKLTTGYDEPGIDCIVLFRATVSPGLYIQMLGRGMRVSEGKTDCLVLDFGGNIQRHGPINRVTPPKTSDGGGVAPTKICPDCHSLVPLSATECPDCRHIFERKPRQFWLDTDSELLQEDLVREPVSSVTFHVHTKRGAPLGAPKTIRVDYHLSARNEYISSWYCPEHIGYARIKFEIWWRRVGGHNAMPSTAWEAVRILNEPGAYHNVKSVLIDYSGRWPRIVCEELADAGNSD